MANFCIFYCQVDSLTGPTFTTAFNLFWFWTQNGVGTSNLTNAPMGFELVTFQFPYNILGHQVLIKCLLS